MELERIIDGTRKAVGRTLATAIGLAALAMPPALAQSSLRSEQGLVEPPAAHDILQPGQIRTYSVNGHDVYLVDLTGHAKTGGVNFYGADLDSVLAFPQDEGIEVIASDGSYKLRSNVSADGRTNYALLLPMSVQEITLVMPGDQGPGTTISPYPDVKNALQATALVRGPDGKPVDWIAYVSLPPGSQVYAGLDTVRSFGGKQ